MTPNRPDVIHTSRFSITETAQKLGVDRRTIYRWIDDKKIAVKYRKSNNRPYITGLEIVKVWESSY
jgi:predicted site-specific integrase-resolvase